ncbi:hypothetical protein HZS55_17205 [Halosimplex rubrum]|uniref:Uncharacterized protein n=1 Tax=Halosimplex rubrum TaxID=869889 RepID=A0A7D5P1S5_9EURY|nr:hypothetical protein [Halosimplex rubrum]QLH78923.1 hypothetical protein HZS55_17205 [Halosimplex rubrum]
MGVRPPSNDVDEEPDVVEFGIAALDARLADADVGFPATAAELRDRFGDATVPYDAAGNEMPVAEALAETDRESFDSEDDLLNALHPVFERKRQAASTSIVKQLRGLVPF